MKPANPKPKPKPKPPAQQASSSSSAAAAAAAAADPNPNPKDTRPTAADPNPNGTRPTAAADSTPTNPNPNGVPNPAPLLASPHPHLPPPLPPPRPLLTVAAVEAAMASIPPPPKYGLESLDRCTVALSDGTVRTYFVLPLEPPPQLRQPLPPPLPPLPVRYLGPPGPVLGADRWPPPPAPAPALLGPAPKRKWEDHQANGGAPGESSGRQQLLQQQKPEERRVAKQVKVEMPEVDAKTLKSSFLKMVKLINDSTEEKKNYRANGKISQLKCAVCGRDSIDLHALLNHSYNAKNAELRADHLGLHKALCVLMGWNYSVDPVHRKAYQTLSTVDAEANQGDLILWPPTIIIENTYKSNNDGQKDGMSNKEVEGKLREMGFAGASVEPLFGKDGQRAMLAKLAGSLAGLNEALRLAEFFEKGGHGRAGRARARSILATADGASNPMLVQVNEKGERTWILYGYLATAWDLDVLDTESKQNVVIKSRKELDLSD